MAVQRFNCLELLASVEANETERAALYEEIKTAYESGELNGEGFEIKGYYDTLADLQSAIPSPAVGDVYGIGSTYPYDIYVWDNANKVWKNNGSIQGPAGPQGGYYVPAIDAEGNLSFTASQDDMPAVDGANIKGGKGDKGDTGAVFTPKVSESGDLSWTNNGDLSNPATVNIKGDKGDQGIIFTPAVSEDGDLSWTNDGNLENPATVNIKGGKGDTGDTGATFTPALAANGDLSWSNDKELANPETVNIKGSKGDTGTTFTPALSANGDLSWSNDGGLNNPSTVNIKGPKGDTGTGLDIRGTFATVDLLRAGVTNPEQGHMYNVGTEPPYTIYMYDDGDWQEQGQLQGAKGEQGVTFTPAVSDSGDLSWTNDGGLSNPATVNIKGGKGDKGNDGITFTPAVSADGDLSWTNDGEADNPATVNIKGENGDTGATFTPAVSADGDLSWTNDKGLSNPTTVNIKGGKGDKGYTPVRGTDYWTAEDIAEIKGYVDDAILGGAW